MMAARIETLNLRAYRCPMCHRLTECYGKGRVAGWRTDVQPLCGRGHRIVGMELVSMDREHGD